MKLKQCEINFIIDKLEKGKTYLEEKSWDNILDELDTLELDIGYIDNDFEKGINDTGRYIERLIDKIAYDEGDDNIIEIEDE